MIRSAGKIMKKRSILAILLAALLPRQLVSLFTKDQTMIQLGAEYLQIIKYACPLLAMTQLLLASLRTVKVVQISLRVSLLSLLVDQTSEGLRTGKFACVAHPDLMNFTGADDVYEKHMRRLCENARAAGVPLEINLLGIRSHRAYPRERFWKLVGEVGNDVVLGGDAHAACDVVDNASEAIAMGWVEKYHLNWHPATWALNKKRL